ncbi:RNA-directed DNA polymerase, eukaryota, nucleotide-binding alpha-beta plait domain protein [Tanacetum coccineum]
MSNLSRIINEEGFVKVKIHYVGGLWLWLHFQSIESCNAFKSNTNLNSFFSHIKPISKNFYVDERMVWVEISGLPLCAWGSNTFKKVASSVGKFMFFEKDEIGAMSLGRVCVATRHKKFISETTKVIIHGEEYDVYIHELGTWNIDIEDSDSYTSETDSKVDEDIDIEEKSVSEEDLDEVQHEKKERKL